jgi:hypothetical protein
MVIAKVYLPLAIFNSTLKTFEISGKSCKTFLLLK